MSLDSLLSFRPWRASRAWKWTRVPGTAGKRILSPWWYPWYPLISYIGSWNSWCMSMCCRLRNEKVQQKNESEGRPGFCKQHFHDHCQHLVSQRSKIVQWLWILLGPFRIWKSLYNTGIDFLPIYPSLLLSFYILHRKNLFGGRAVSMKHAVSKMRWTKEQSIGNFELQHGQKDHVEAVLARCQHAPKRRFFANGNPSIYIYYRI